MRGIVATAGGGVLVRLSQRERELLQSLPDQLRPLLAGDDTAPNVSARLYPPGYDDEQLEAEYRELIGSDLVAQRLGAMDAFAQTLAGGTVTRGRWTTQLDAESAQAWLSAVNDARLILGQLLGITDESDWEHGPSDDNPTSVVMYYLGWVQEELVTALMGALPDV
jgi:hypothetical protein